MSFHKKTIKDVPLEHKTVLVRAGYDVPLTSDGEVEDDLRIQASLPTLKYLIKERCKIVLMAHLGRPKGVDLAFSLRPVAQRLEELLEKPVTFVDQTVGEKVRMTIKKAPAGSVILLENLRFNEGEKENSVEFARQLARDSGAKYFVQDAFSNAHRQDASMAAITQFIPSVAGLQLENEVRTITSALPKPQRPFVAIMGGAKVSDKIHVITRFVEIADRILIGGAMANTFLAFKGYDVGASKVESDQMDTVKQIYDQITKKVGHGNEDTFLILPQDLAVATDTDDKAAREVVPVNKVGQHQKCLDIGDAAIETFVEQVKSARTVVWNGTLGYAELPNFSHGSARVALALATQPDTLTIIGGGDTADFIRHWDARNGGSFSHVSTGGGASLDLMAGNPLPGVEYLLDA